MMRGNEAKPLHEQFPTDPYRYTAFIPPDG
jgi:hypothetical protein